MCNIDKLISELGGKSAPVLSVLLAVQDENPARYVDEESVISIAQALGVSTSRIYSTASFYDEISLEPRGKHLVSVCVNAPCENANSRSVKAALKKALGIDFGQTTRDGLFTLEKASCLGACYMSPAIRIDGTVYGDMTTEKIWTLITQIRAEDEHEPA